MVECERWKVVVEMGDGLFGLSRRQSYITFSYPLKALLENFETFVEFFLPIHVIKCRSNNESES